ncbi:ATP-dependent DNA helicase PIF1-like [Senna tora]|uniref:ATP-dependent DNA helicase n=1 Tax=Senna tora TaxID=362788 RepID=A0A834THE8_9FABA|nr:ATP-dependent DNA helicase PIF1-like [Senna tora]
MELRHQIFLGGRTAHSRFKIRINGNEMSVCNIPKQSGLADLIRRAKLIIWDKAPMTKQWAIEAVDRSLQDIMSNNMLFGGSNCFRRRLQTSLLVVGNEEEISTHDRMIQIPNKMLINCNNENDAEQCLIEEVFPSLSDHAHCSDYISSHAILATNEAVDMLNEKLINIFPGESWIYNSFDQALDDNANYYQKEFLNSLTPNGLPPHKLIPKLNFPIMVLRNIDPANGLYNGTRLVCKGFESNVIHAEISSGQHIGKKVLLVRILLMPTEGECYPFQIRRMQLPIRLSFAMTINKAQGQTIPHVGVYLQIFMWLYLVGSLF